MSTRTSITIISLLFSFCAATSQNVRGVYKIGQLLNRISHADTTYVINFWATWCKPCVSELPAFDSLYEKTKDQRVKIILVSLDFKEDLEKKVNPFLLKHDVKSECVLLDEINGNDFIDKISNQWSGAIPATLFKHGKRSGFLEQKIILKDLEKYILKVK